jgi:hypothetical protein
VICCDRITHVQKNISVFDIINWGQASTKLLEERWVVDISGIFVPSIKFSLWSIKILPHL